MKNINWKKYAGAAMAAAMIPAAVAPIATEAAGIYGLHNGWNIKVTLDGKPANNLFAEKGIYLVGKTDGKVYKQQSGKVGKVWVPGGQTYDIYDVTKTKKGQIKVFSNGNTTIGKVNYNSVYAADVPLTDESSAYYEDKNSKGTVGFEGIYTKNTEAKLIVNGQEKKFNQNVTAHAPATIEYDLTGKNLNHFTASVGLDERRNSGAVQVTVYVDGQPYGSPFVQNKGDEAKILDIDLTGAEKLKFVVTGKDTNKNAVIVFGDAKFR